MRRRISTLFLALGLAALAPASASAAPPQWGECPPEAAGPGMECATLAVPLDYRAPEGQTIEIAVSRLRSEDPASRRGVLLLNPGGPGGAGLGLPLLYARILPANVRARYDLIGFDPRGIQRSAPTSCALPEALLDVTRFIPWPAADGSIDENTAYSRAVADACAAGGAGGRLPFMTTANTARDMDRIRAALGESTISYLGVSYGTYLGGVYASLFPGRTDRFVFDSNVHPGRIWRPTFRAWGYAIELRFPDFARFAAENNDTYGLGATSAEVRRLYFELAARLEREPVTLPGDLVLTRRLFLHFTRQGLNTDRAFPELAFIWQLAKEGGATAGAAPEAAAALEALFPDPPPDNPYVGAWAVLCDDADWPESPERYRRDSRLDGALFPLAGAMAANIWPCAFWDSEPRERPVTIGGGGPGKVLVVQSLRDPSTPWDGGLAMRVALGRRARLVSVDLGGHVVTYGAPGDSNSCADELTSRFLAEGDFPRRDRFCPADPAGPRIQADSARTEAIEERERRAFP